MVAKLSQAPADGSDDATTKSRPVTQSENETATGAPTSHPSSAQVERQPLANISSKMQSSTPQSGSRADASNKKPDLDLPFQAEFGKASPLRNPLLGNTSRAPAKTSNLFVDKKKPRPNPVPGPSAQNATRHVSAARDFFNDDSDDALERLQAGMTKQPKTIFQIPIPTNKPSATIYAPAKPMFSSTAPLPQSTISKSKVKEDDSDDNSDDFDPDAAVRKESDKFGAVDPYMYLDGDKANNNIKNLLEGAFDDDLDKPTTRLRGRKPNKIPTEAETKSLADKLSSLSVAPTTKEPQRDEPDDGTVEGLAVKLLPHQIDGVSWMIDKEAGKRKNGVLPRGGILADDMGLGKTVQSVALILLNPRSTSEAESASSKQKQPPTKVSKSTLVVAPLALIRQWEDEIKTKVNKSHALKVLVHHGSSRTKSPTELKKYDVVVTTYQILTSEHAASDDENMVGCFGVHWYRVILDEAHSIKNRNAKSSIACCALRSWNRWCLTGTPMQNNLDELQSLIKFLRIKPYCELSSWKQQIIQPIKSGRGGLAMARLHHYLNAFMKRRTKDVLKKDGALGGGDGIKSDFKIVKREVINVECSFDEQEQVFYDRLSDRATSKINAMMGAGGSKDYMGALVLLLRLRQACNHPALVEKAIDKDREAVDASVQANTRPSDEMDDLADLMGSISVKSRNCDVCGSNMTKQQIESGQSRCDECEKDLKQFKPARVKRRQRVLEDSDDESDGSGFSDSPDDASTDLQVMTMPKLQDGTSTKIREIAKILHQESKEHKTIVFSQFTSMLDIIQPHIKQRFVRYDGSMKPDEREAALNSLRNDAKTRVLLCSLKCGSLGLNLTAASRVIIVEPFWNPFVEEQAIDRVHRLNQTVDVKVYRLTIAGSVEERILSLQEKKRELAAAAIEGGKAAGKLSMNDILSLFRSDAQTAEMHEMDRKFAEKIGYDSKLINGSQASPARQNQVREATRPAPRPEHQIYGRRW